MCVCVWVSFARSNLESAAGRFTVSVYTQSQLFCPIKQCILNFMRLSHITTITNFFSRLSIHRKCNRLCHNAQMFIASMSVYDYCLVSFWLLLLSSLLCVLCSVYLHVVCALRTYLSRKFYGCLSVVNVFSPTTIYYYFFNVKTLVHLISLRAIFIWILFTRTLELRLCAVW